MLLQGAGRLFRQQQRAAPTVVVAWWRGLAEQASKEAPSKYAPPVPVHGTAGRYAAALYMAGARANKLDKINSDLSQVSDAAEGSTQFRDFLKDPSIPKAGKQGALEAILSGMGVCDLTKNFFGVLAENNRLGEYMKISTTFEELVAAAKGEILASVTTAGELPAREMDEIRNGLNSLLEQGQKLIVQEKIDPSIIGGIVIDIGDKHIDLSISSRIKKIQQMVLQNV